VSEHNETGKLGEKLATEFLVSKSYKILERNWHSGHKEIDIIAKKDNQIIIIEVKTRRSLYFEKPYESVTKKKQELLIEAAENYLIENNLDIDVQFDIISIYIENTKPFIEHIQDAFSPEF